MKNVYICFSSLCNFFIGLREIDFFIGFFWWFKIFWIFEKLYLLFCIFFFLKGSFLIGLKVRFINIFFWFLVVGMMLLICLLFFFLVFFIICGICILIRVVFLFIIFFCIGIIILCFLFIVFIEFLSVFFFLSEVIFL